MTTTSASNTRAAKDACTFPASFAQQRLWFLDQLQGESTTAYTLIHTVRIGVPVNEEALGRSLNALVGRHEVLRTTFVVRDEQPLQVVAPALTLTLPVVNLCALPPQEREAEALRLANVQAQRPFDLARDPAQSHALPPGRVRLPAAAALPPHHLRRLVQRRLLPRTAHLLPGLLQRARAHAGSSAHPVRRLRRLAARAAARRRTARRAAGLLAAAPGRSACRAGTAHRSPTPGHPQQSGRQSPLQPPLPARPGAQSPEPAGGGEPVYDPGRRLRGPALPL